MDGDGIRNRIDQSAVAGGNCRSDSAQRVMLALCFADEQAQYRVDASLLNRLGELRPDILR